jgi:uncharacterized protein involved in outer membrane biogenesis
VKTLVKVLAGLLGLALVLVVVFVLCFDWIAKQVMQKALGKLTGSEVRIGAVEYGMYRGTLRISGLVVGNPPGFGGSPLLDLPELYLESDPTSATTDVVRFKKARIDLAEVSIVVDAQGRTNIHSLGLDLEELQKREKEKGAATSSRFGGVDELTVSLGKLTSIDLRPPARTNTIVLGLKEEKLRNVRTLADLTPLLFKLVLGGAFNALAPGR